MQQQRAARLFQDAAENAEEMLYFFSSCSLALDEVGEMGRSASVPWRRDEWPN